MSPSGDASGEEKAASGLGDGLAVSAVPLPAESRGESRRKHEEAVTFAAEFPKGTEGVMEWVLGERERSGKV